MILNRRVVTVVLLIGLTAYYNLVNTSAVEESLTISPVRSVVDSSDTSQLHRLHTLGLSVDITVAPDGDLQGAVMNAIPGDSVVLMAGATYVRSVSLPIKSGSSYITIKSSRADELVGRVNPSQVGLMATVISDNSTEPTFYAPPGSHHYKLLGLNIKPASPGQAYSIVTLGQSGSAQTTFAQVPHDFAIEKNWIHGGPTQEVQRGITLNAANVSITDNYISDIHGVGYDTQAICGWNGPGPYQIINNHLEAAGENVMFGGALPSITGLIPSNIEIRRNFFFKPLSWKVGDPSYAGIHWTVKNWLEFKNAQDVVFEDNDFENNWADAQVGYGWLFTVRSEDGKAPWATVRRIRGVNNRVRNTEHAMQLMGADWSAGSVLSPSQGGSDLYLGNNSFEGVRSRFAVVQEFARFTLEHNTHFQGGSIFILLGNPSTGLRYVNNVTVRHDYGIFGDGVGEGNAALQRFAPSADIKGNVIVNADVRNYPPDNFYPDDLLGLTGFKGTDGLVPGYSAGGAIPTPTATPVITPSPTPPPSPTPVVTPSLSPSSSSSPSLPTSPDGTRIPTAAQITDDQGAVWTLNGDKMLRNGLDTGGLGTVLQWCSGRVYGLGKDTPVPQWYQWTGRGWMLIEVNPCVVVLPSPSPSVTPSPTPVPTVTPTPTAMPTPAPSPTPSPSPAPLPFCISGQRPGNPPVCRCKNGMLGSSGKCR